MQQIVSFKIVFFVNHKLIIDDEAVKQYDTIILFEKFKIKNIKENTIEALQIEKKLETAGTHSVRVKWGPSDLFSSFYHSKNENFQPMPIHGKRRTEMKFSVFHT